MRSRKNILTVVGGQEGNRGHWGRELDTGEGPGVCLNIACMKFNHVHFVNQYFNENKNLKIHQNVLKFQGHNQQTWEKEIVTISALECREFSSLIILNFQNFIIYVPSFNL